MHCPRCGQQQVSNETKFCSRCGFQLGLVSELLANNGFLPQLAALYEQKPTFLTRKNGVIFSVLWFITWVMMIPAFIAIEGGEDAAAGVAAFGFFTSIMLLVASFGFLKKSPKSTRPLYLETAPIPAAALYGNAGANALPPQQSQPVSSYTAPQGSWRTPDTGELATPGTVTEGTTKLLKKEEG